MNTNDLPVDWHYPDFNNRERVHDWKNYTTAEVEKEWHDFSDYQKQILAACFQATANTEEWD